MDYLGIREKLLTPVHSGVPVDLTADPRRRFRRVMPCEVCKGRGLVPTLWDWDEGFEDFGCGTCDISGNNPDAPADLTPGEQHIAAIADSPAFETAETLARQTAEALVPWGYQPPEHVVWRVGAILGPAYHVVLPRQIRDQISQQFRSRFAAAIDIRALGLGYLGDDRPLPEQIMRSQAEEHARWANAVELGLTFPEDLPEGVAGRPVADLPNPFTPLLEIWRTGFALDLLTDDAIQLYAHPFA